MVTIHSSYTASTEVKRSKFIAYFIPISDFKGMQERLKLENPKANHVVYALRYLNEYNQIVENSSDDGEPKGCAGTPILNVLRGGNIINVAILVVRYFGGIKLGTGGMVRAYAQSAKCVIEESPLVLYEKMVEYEFETSYSSVQKMEYLLSQIGVESISKEFGVSSVSWQISTTKQRLDTLRDRVERGVML